MRKLIGETFGLLLTVLVIWMIGVGVGYKSASNRCAKEYFNSEIGQYQVSDFCFHAGAPVDYEKSTSTFEAEHPSNQADTPAREACPDGYKRTGAFECTL